MNQKYETALADYVKFTFADGRGRAPSFGAARALR